MEKREAEEEGRSQGDSARSVLASLSPPLQSSSSQTDPSRFAFAVAFAQIDWQDFVVVENIEFTSEDEAIQLEAPTSITKLDSLTMAQKMMATTLGEQPVTAAEAVKEDQPEEDMEMDMDEEEEETQDSIEAKKKAAEAERAKEVQRKFAEQQGTMKIRKDYVPKGGCSLSSPFEACGTEGVLTSFRSLTCVFSSSSTRDRSSVGHVPRSGCAHRRDHRACQDRAAGPVLEGEEDRARREEDPGFAAATRCVRCPFRLSLSSFGIRLTSRSRRRSSPQVPTSPPPSEISLVRGRTCSEPTRTRRRGSSRRTRSERGVERRRKSSGTVTRPRRPLPSTSFKTRATWMTRSPRSTRLLVSRSEFLSSSRSPRHVQSF